MSGARGGWAALREKVRRLFRPGETVAAYCAHELRTPLTVMRVAAAMLRDGESLTPEQQQLVNLIEGHTAAMGRLVDGLLDLAKLRDGKLELRLAAVAPLALAQDAVAFVAPAAAAKGVRLGVRGSGDEPAVQADAERVQQVLSNLLANALKFTPAGGGVTVGVEGVDVEDGAVLFSVEDTGPGIPAADRRKVFDAFYQSGRANRKTGGTGLGLTISKALVELHGGRIWADNAPDGGARFRFTLPVEGTAERAGGWSTLAVVTRAAGLVLGVLGLRG